jgi:hypothetical protein
MASNLTIDSTSSNCDISFQGRKGDGSYTTAIHFDSLFLPIAKGSGGYEIIYFIYTGLFFDSVNKDKGFFKFSNCKDLLKNIFETFGIMPIIKFVCNTMPSNVSVNIDFVGRKVNYSTPLTLENPLPNPKRSISTLDSKGIKITTTYGIGDYLLGAKSNIEKTFEFFVYPYYNNPDYPGLLTDVIVPLGLGEELCYHSLCIWEDSKMFYITKVSVSGFSTNYEEVFINPPVTTGEYHFVWNCDSAHYLTLQAFARAMADYYCDPEKGIYGLNKKEYSMQIPDVKGDISGDKKFNYFKPGYDYVYNNNTYKITKTKKNLVKDLITDMTVTKYD